MVEIRKTLGDKAKDCSLGILVMENVQNTFSGELEPVRQAIEKELMEKYAGTDRAILKALHPMDAYISYYKKFGYSYHVLPQMESVVRGKKIPGGLPLVEAMFIAELQNMLLTAGHDLDKIDLPLHFSVSNGQKSYLTLSGRETTTVEGDYLLSDRKSVISSILRGPDRRTAITEETSRVLYSTYAPSGVEEELIIRHLNDIERYVHLFSKEAVTILKEIY